MGNTWTGVNEKVFLEYEKRMLIYSGIPYEDFDVSNVIIDEDQNYIRTIRVGDKGKQLLILVHGYGGSGVMFWKIIKTLSERFNVYLIDILGMGGSSRPKFTIKDPQVADEYLIAWLETWRQKMGLSDFVLAGHSFGGYVCGLYTCRYQQHVKKLLMLSPLGVTRCPEDFDLMKELEKFPRGRRPPKFAIDILKKAWIKQWSPFGILRKSGRGCFNCLIRRYAKNRLGSVHQTEINDFKNYLHQILLRDGSTEYAIFVCFSYLMFALHPLEEDDRLGGISIPVSFFYGDRDWMPKEGGIRVIEKNPFKESHSHLHIIEDSDHHMYFDNPDEFSKRIIEDLENLDELGPSEPLTLRITPHNENVEDSMVRHNKIEIVDESNQVLV